MIHGYTTTCRKPAVGSETTSLTTVTSAQRKSLTESRKLSSAHPKGGDWCQGIELKRRIAWHRGGLRALATPNTGARPGPPEAARLTSEPPVTSSRGARQ
jgi:hypothetical protein